MCLVFLVNAIIPKTGGMCSLYNLADGLMIGQISLVVGIYNFVQDVSQDERYIISGIYGGGPSLTDVQYSIWGWANLD